MQVSKVIGYFFVLAGCSGLGLWYSAQMLKRVVHMREMIRILDIVKSEMKYNHGTLPECCERISEKAKEPYAECFQKINNCFQAGSGMEFDRICKENLQESLQNLPLKEERDVFVRCFSDIGYGDIWMQHQTMERGKQELQGILDAEEEELKKRSKLAISLGAMSGILLVLILL